MYNNGLKTIGVFLTELHTEFQNLLCKGISIRARELGYNVAYFCWDNPYGQQKGYLKGESNIFNLPDYSKIDAVVYLKDTFSEIAVENMLEERLDKLDVPKVAVRCNVDGYYNIRVDNATGISAMVKHFIEEHNCTKIAYLSGKREMLDSKLRLETYRKVMDEYGLEYDDSYIFHGNYWRDSAPEACDYFLKSHFGRPEAIVCANDYMAVAVVEELEKKGIKVPTDVKVSGFDNISEAREGHVSLTTVDIPVQKMAFSAVEIIDNVLNNREQEDLVRIDAEPVFRNSCGCGKIHEEKHDCNCGGNQDYHDIFNSNRALRYMTVALEGASTLEQLSEVVDRFMYVHDHYKNFFMCLTKKDKKSNLNTVSSIKKGYSSDSLCALAILDRGHTGDYPLVFKTENMIPPMYITEEPQIYYFMPLHFLENNYGYIAINYEDNGRVTESLNTFITHISSALDSIHNKAKLQKALEELELLYVTDPLTNLYNRRGFELNATEMFENCKKNNTPVMVMTIDMDGMKSINDNFGHAQGDIAIKMIGKALSYAITGKEICARVGGDEFNVIAGDYSEEEGERFIQSVIEYMEGYNEVNSMPFSVEVSYGSVLIDEFEVGNLEYYINISDNRMYKQKFRKKKGKRESDMQSFID